MGLTLTDSLFNLEYLSLNVGGTISASADVMTSEQITITIADKLTVSEEPKDFGSAGTCGWFHRVGDENWTKIVFDPTTKTADVAGLAVDDVVCVKYIKTDASAEKFTVSSSFIPSQCYALLTLPLFKTGTTNTGASASSSSKVGEVQVEIPNFMLAGAQDLSLTAAGAATTSLSGNALVTYGNNTSCDAEGYYAVLKQIIFGKDEWADVKAIVVADSDIDLEVDETQTLEVYALYGGTKAPRLIEASKLTFTSDTTATATVDATGKVTAVAAGNAIIEVVVTDKTELVAKAAVSVS